MGKCEMRIQARRFEKIIERMIKTGLVRKRQFRPSSVRAIIRLEDDHQVQLPEAYKCYLRTMGRGAGKFFTSDHWYAGYDSVYKHLGTRCEAGQHLEVPLPEKAFVFATRMGDWYLFFVADGKNQDPPVFAWGDSGVVKRGFDSIWGSIASLAKDYEYLARAKRRLRDSHLPTT